MNDLSSEIDGQFKALHKLLEKLKQAGDPALLKRMAAKAKETMGIDESQFASLIAKADETRRQHRISLGNDLRKLALKHGLGFDFVPPHVRVGCVNFFEKADCVWEVKVLDSFLIRVVRTAQGEELVSVAMKVIEEIEDALANKEELYKSLWAAYGELNYGVDGSQGVSPNLLMMVLGAGGKSVRKALECFGDPKVEPRRRYLMAYLLAALKTEGESGLSCVMSPATQHQTSELHRCMTIPRDVDPRKLGSGGVPVAKVQLRKREGNQ